MLTIALSLTIMGLKVRKTSLIFVLYCILMHIFILYYVLSYRIVSYRVVSYRIVSYRIDCIVSYRIVSYRILSYRLYRIDCIVSIVSYRIVSYRIDCIVSYRIVSYRIVSYLIVSIVSYRIVSYRIVSYRIVLYHFSNACHLILFLCYFLGIHWTLVALFLQIHSTFLIHNTNKVTRIHTGLKFMFFLTLGNLFQLVLFGTSLCPTMFSYQMENPL